MNTGLCVVCGEPVPLSVDIRKRRRTCPPPKACAAIRRKEMHNASSAKGARKRRAKKAAKKIDRRVNLLLKHHAERARAAPAGYLEPDVCWNKVEGVWVRIERGV